MDTARAFEMCALNQGKTMMVFDWHKAARLIVEQRPQIASAGLRGDWEWTGGEIYCDGLPVPPGNTYTYLSSTWAVPELDLDGQVIECFIMEDVTDWDAHTYWPDEAVALLGIVDGED